MSILSYTLLFKKYLNASEFKTVYVKNEQTQSIMALASYIFFEMYIAKVFKAFFMIVFYWRLKTKY